MKKTKTETAAPAAPAAPAPKEQPAGLKKVNLAGIAAKPAAGKPMKSYPVMPDPDGQVAVLVTSILERAAQVEALEGALELDKSE